MPTAAQIISGVQGLKTMLTPILEKEIKDRISQNEKWLTNHRYSIYKREREQDEGPARQALMSDKKTLARRSAHRDFTAQEKSVINKHRKELEEKIKIGMPTKDEMMGKRQNVDGNPNKKCQVAQPAIVKKHMAWDKRNAANCRDWKQIMRLLEPDDPNVANVENLRKIN